ncbi:hypothetical protein MMD27_000290 [Acinetobacter baumannii]|nr:hypothetical protein [Acinetobacter baumannii]
MFDTTTTHSVETPVQEPLKSVVQLLMSAAKGKLITLPLVWQNGKKGSITLYSGTIYKITSVDDSESNDSKCTVYYVDEHSPESYNSNGQFKCTLSMDEVIQLINK